MKIFFINPPFKAEYGKFSRENRSPAVTRSGTFYYPLWLIYAAAVCEKDGFEVEFLDAPAKPMSKEEAMIYIKEHGKNTKLFVLETSTPSVYSDVNFADHLKKMYPDSIVILVGTHCSALPVETLKLGFAYDAVARHEFDYIIRDVARALRDGKNWKDTLGLTYRNSEIDIQGDDLDVGQNPDMPYLEQEDLDNIPFAAEFVYKHLNYKDYFFAGSYYPELQLFTGRGCPAQCRFCVYPQTMHGHKYRLRSSKNVVDEFEYITKHFPDVKHIVIEDDTFTINKKRVVEICQMIIDRGIKLKWLCNARVNLDYETMVMMKKAGCRQIIPGIESGNQEILNNIHKGTKLEQVVQYCSDAKKAGLLVHACYMVGNMGETKQTMENTLEFALKLNTDAAQFYPLLPFPGTEAYNWAKSNGYITANKYSEYLKENGEINCVLNLPNLSSDQMVEFCDYARQKYYWRPSYIVHRLWVGIHDPQDLKRSLKAFSRIWKFLIKPSGYKG